MTQIPVRYRTPEESAAYAAALTPAPSPVKQLEHVLGNPECVKRILDEAREIAAGFGGLDSVDCAVVCRALSEVGLRAVFDPTPIVQVALLRMIGFSVISPASQPRLGDAYVRTGGGIVVALGLVHRVALEGDDASPHDASATWFTCLDGHAINRARKFPRGGNVSYFLRWPSG